MNIQIIVFFQIKLTSTSGLNILVHTQTHASRLASKFTQTHTYKKGGREGGKKRGKETLRRKKPLSI